MGGGPGTLEVKAAMRDASSMVIGGVAGRWNSAGDVWSADDVTGTDAVLLVRISDAEEGEIDGVARQVADTCACAVRSGSRVRFVLVENDTSAFKRKKILLPNGKTELRTIRPKFRRALDILTQASVTRFHAYDLDRTVRDPRDLEDLIDVVEGSTPRVVCESVTGSLRLANDADITMARVLCAMNNKSSRDTARRVSRARLQQAEEGRFGGGRRRYGWESDGLTVRPDEARVIVRCAENANAKVKLREIARDLNSDGIPATDGGRWTAERVRDMLLRPRNAGLLVHRQGVRGRKVYTPDDVVGTLPGEPIIKPDVYWSIVHKLTDPSRRTNGAGVAAKWFGSGIYLCPCGATLRAQRKVHRKKNAETGEVKVYSERMIYRCQTTNGQNHVIIPLEELDALTEATIFERVRTSRPEELIGTRVQGQADAAALRAELGRLHERLEEVAADRAEDLITRAQMLTMTTRINEKATALQQQLDAITAQDDNPVNKLIGVKDIKKAWKDLTFGEQREVLRRLLHVEVQPVGRGRRPAVRDRVTIAPRPPAA